MKLTPSAVCPCGWSHRVREKEAGQTVYGTLAGYMGEHERKCSIATQENGVSRIIIRHYFENDT